MCVVMVVCLTTGLFIAPSTDTVATSYRSKLKKLGFGFCTRNIIYKA